MLKFFKNILMGTLSLGLIVSLTATAEKSHDEENNSLVRFEGGIGSQPLRAGGTPNLVHGLNPGGAPWIIRRLSVNVELDGHISAVGRGLLLGGGNSIGYNGNQSVRARLVCSGVFYDSKLVPLEPNGDFRIDDILLPLPPNPCANAVLLIVNPNGSWFAAGIPKLGKDD
jgi:hypothetical protein